MTQQQQWFVGQLGVFVAFVGFVAQVLIQDGTAVLGPPWSSPGAEGWVLWGFSIAAACLEGWIGGSTPPSWWPAPCRHSQAWRSWFSRSADAPRRRPLSGRSTGIPVRPSSALSTRRRCTRRGRRHPLVGRQWRLIETRCFSVERTQTASRSTLASGGFRGKIPA